MERLGNEELWMDLEHEQRLTAVEERSKSNSHRLDKLEESNEVISRLATSMEVMANKQEQVADTVDKLGRQGHGSGTEAGEALGQVRGKADLGNCCRDRGVRSGSNRAGLVFRRDDYD